jgi:hypothetical protein
LFTVASFVVVVVADVDVAAVDDVVVVVAVDNFVVSVIVVVSVVEKEGSLWKSRSFVGRFNSSFPVTP